MLKIRPLELRLANAYVAALHRHHKPVVGHRFSIGCYRGEELVGVAIAGRPVARQLNSSEVLEVTRLCTDGTANACSKLYAAAARAAQALGYLRIQTYILECEPGTSLLAAGFRCTGVTKNEGWDRTRRPRPEQAEPCRKKRFERLLNA